MVHPWYRLSMFQKRMHCFLVYQLSSWVSLFNPVAVDKALYKELKDQFEGPNKPTHRCKVCGAFWLKGDGFWQLLSDTCGDCCDNAPMGEQIEKI